MVAVLVVVVMAAAVRCCRLLGHSLEAQVQPALQQH
jgi:hypothetical protein